MERNYLNTIQCSKRSQNHYDHILSLIPMEIPKTIDTISNRVGPLARGFQYDRQNFSITTKAYDISYTTYFKTTAQSELNKNSWGIARQLAKSTLIYVWSIVYQDQLVMLVSIEIQTPTPYQVVSRFTHAISRMRGYILCLIDNYILRTVQRMCYLWLKNYIFCVFFTRPQL